MATLIENQLTNVDVEYMFWLIYQNSLASAFILEISGSFSFPSLPLLQDLYWPGGDISIWVASLVQLDLLKINLIR